MNILGIGIDITKIDRIKRIWKKYKISFAKKILTSKEIILLNKKKNKTQFLAKCFTAKEAFVKAIGTGFKHGITFKNIDISNNELGKPIINNNIKNIKLKNTHTFISISHERDIVIAIVIITKYN
ncbi:MAG: holo-ACP synthase [Enterobacteriaceae bacterium]|nr:holo-ACP synthase [Enterobacteriaceae bacterium]